MRMHHLFDHVSTSSRLWPSAVKAACLERSFTLQEGNDSVRRLIMMMPHDCNALRICLYLSYCSQVVEMTCIVEEKKKDRPPFIAF